MSTVVIKDGLLTPVELNLVDRHWPKDDWPGWYCYEGVQKGKRVSDRTTPIPPVLGQVLTRMAALPVAEWFQVDSPLIPDLSLCGSGLHEMMPGCELPRHLDADTSSRLGTERVLSACLYVHNKWNPLWGGELEVNSISIDPKPGRLVIFDARTSWHQVYKVRRDCPPRRALAMFWYSINSGKGERPRALFSNFTPEQQGEVKNKAVVTQTGVTW